MSGKRTIDSVRIADRAASIERSKIRYMFDRAQQHGGDELIHLEIGEPDFDTPDHIVEAAYEAASDGATHYTSNAGIPELRSAIADWMARERDLEVDPTSGIVVTTGAMEALHLATLTVVDPGERVVIPEPAWPNYRAQARLAGAEPVAVALPEDRGFELAPDRIVGEITEETALVVLTTPSNPTGRVYSREAVREVVEAAAEHDAYVIADEVYSGIEYGTPTPSVASMCDHPDHVLTIDSVSKKYAMTGWRIGWFVGHESIAEQVSKLHESTSACAPTPSQHAALAALEGSQDPVERMVDTYAERRDYLVDRLATVPHVTCHAPEGAIYAFADVGSLGMSSLEAAERLLDDYGVVVAPGGGFGEAGDGYVRISFANSLENIEAGLDAIEAFATEVDA